MESMAYEIMKGVQCALRPSRPCKSAVGFWWSKRVTEWPLGISQIYSINSSTTKTRNRGEQSCKHCNFPASASLPSWGEGGILRASHPPDQLGNTFKIRETILLNSRRSRRIPDCLDLMAYTAISTFWPASDCSQLPRGRRRLAMA